jgi:hypothetical protein
MSQSQPLLPLCVDLDDTLIHADVLFLGLQQLALSKPWLLPWFMVWLCLSRAAAKAWLARNVELDAALLPYRAELVDYLTKQKAAGRHLFLISAADEHIVKRVAAHIGLFKAAYGSNGHINLKGSAKAKFIVAHIGKDFVYAGDSFADLQVWKVAHSAILCGDKARILKPILQIPIEANFK